MYLLLQKLMQMHCEKGDKGDQGLYLLLQKLMQMHYIHQIINMVCIVSSIAVMARV